MGYGAFCVICPRASTSICYATERVCVLVYEKCSQLIGQPNWCIHWRFEPPVTRGVIARIALMLARDLRMHIDCVRSETSAGGRGRGGASRECVARFLCTAELVDLSTLARLLRFRPVRCVELPARIRTYDGSPVIWRQTVWRQPTATGRHILVNWATEI